MCRNVTSVSSFDLTATFAPFEAEKTGPISIQPLGVGSMGSVVCAWALPWTGKRPMTNMRRAMRIAAAMRKRRYLSCFIVKRVLSGFVQDCVVCHIQNNLGTISDNQIVLHMQFFLKPIILKCVEIRVFVMLTTIPLFR